jgi:UDP-N-acetyl-D-galactosamine dehydrogenase
MNSPTVAIIGLGYVGTPLLAAFAEVGPVIGFDVDTGRVEELKAGKDRTEELDERERELVSGMPLTADPAELVDATVYIVTVPTPVMDDHTPDLRPLERASETLGPILKAGDTVIYESTVYPGATEEVCVPILARLSGLEPQKDFWYGYSPERINPGDRERRLQGIVKVTSGCCPASAAFIDQLYAKIIPAGTHRASSVRVAEAAKVIENTQRDVNIALVNELAMLFDRLGLDTHEVLEAAGTKWNFLPFRPGLVGGHCIGVDPYYLTHKAQEVGFDPNIILAGRGVNDGMAGWVAGRVVGLMADRGIAPEGSRALVLGLTFKENCPDTRNSQVFRLVGELQAAGCEVDVHDPWVEPDGARGLKLIDAPEPDSYDVVVLAVAHREFHERGVPTLKGYGREGAVVYDVKGLFDAAEVAGRL